MESVPAPFARKLRIYRLLIITLVGAAVALHEFVDSIFLPQLSSPLGKILFLTVLAGVCIGFGLHLLNTYTTEHRALNIASERNLILQGELSKTIANLKDSLTIAELRNVQLKLTAELIESLHHCTTEDEIARRIGDRMLQVLEDWGGTLYLGQPETALVRRISWPPGIGHRALLNPRRCPAFQDGKPQIEGSLRCSSCAPKTELPSPRLSCFPLGRKQSPLGMLCSHSIVNTTDRSPHAATAISVLTIIQNQLGLALQNLRSRASLGDLALRDALTGAFNRRYLEETLGREVARSLREKSALAVVMMDLDHFKQLNDTMGHATGDVVLKALVKKLTERFRTGDIICRFGGEEFVVIMPGASALVARGKADQVRREIHELSGLVRHQRVISVSMGIAAVPENGVDPRSLIRAADLALYEAKRRGRDQIVIAPRNSSLSECSILAADNVVSQNKSSSFEISEPS